MVFRDCRSMRNNNGRRLDHKTLEDIRLRAVERVEAGAHPEDVAEVLGFARRLFLSGWLSAEVVVLQRYGPITDEGVVVGGAFDSDTAVGKCRLRTRAAGVLASR